jgi:hypothetical protein
MTKGRALTQLSRLLSGRMPRDPDWCAILTLASETLIAPALYARIENMALPEDVRTFLAQVRSANRERNESMALTTAEAGDLLNQAGVEPILLKGMALRALVGERAADRMMSDIDLLVRPAEFEKALDRLERAGFNIAEDKRFLARHPVVALGRFKDAGGIDLHQHPPGGVIVSDIHSRCARATFFGARVRIPPPELQMLISVWHDQWHEGRFWRGGFHLRHLMDIAILADWPGIDWREVYAMCDDGVQRLAVRAQALAARRLVNARVPDHAVSGAWPELAYQRQRLQCVWPFLNEPLRRLGLTREIWRPLSQRMTQRVRA